METRTFSELDEAERYIFDLMDENAILMEENTNLQRALNAAAPEGDDLQ